MRDDLSMLKHATRRYPNEMPMLALMQLQSDRRAAGLGALDERRRSGIEVFRTKSLDYTRAPSSVVYRLGVNRSGRHVIPRIDFTSLNIEDTIRCEWVPPVVRCFILRIDAMELSSQRERDITARCLWHARKELRSAIEAASREATEP